MTWIIVTNTNSCRIFLYKNKPLSLTLIKELQHPEAKLKDSELGADRPGRYQHNSITPRSAFDPTESMQEVEIENFAKEINMTLEQGRNHQLYDQLIIVAPPRMMGILNKQMENQVKLLIKDEITKDYTQIQPRDLIQTLREHIVI